MFTQEVKEFPGTDVLADIIVDNKVRKSAAVAYNISRGGICFVTSSLLSNSDRCLIYLKKNRNLFQAQGRVKWGRQIDPKDNMFRYGLEFKDPLEGSYIDLFIRCCN